jgi:RNA polymerase sigma-70 factor, ECF subfamily
MQGAQDVEAELGTLLRAQSYDRAATLALHHYGPELYGFLVNLMSDEHVAGEVFAQASEDLWRGLAGFASQCSVRTWMYVLARHAASRYRRSPWNRGGRSGDSAIDELVADARSRTAPWLRTEVKDRWRALREALDPDDRALLVLRVDRNLEWADVARVMLDAERPQEAELQREAARLRKRFQLLKDELRVKAIASGLVEG